MKGSGRDHPLSLDDMFPGATERLLLSCCCGHISEQEMKQLIRPERDEFGKPLLIEKKRS